MPDILIFIVIFVLTFFGIPFIVSVTSPKFAFLFGIPVILTVWLVLAGNSPVNYKEIIVKPNTIQLEDGSSLQIICYNDGNDLNVVNLTAKLKTMINGKVSVKVVPRNVFSLGVLRVMFRPIEDIITVIPPGEKP
jgi:hypothetical protein